MNQKIAVVLFNLGGPDKPESIYPFLVNFFMDKNIIRAPYPVRFLLSRYIALKRSRNEAGSSYAALGGKSPLLENTQAQAAALQTELGDDYKVFVCMRYWHPMADEVVEQVRAYNPDRVMLLPLYPQYSTTTTRSSLQEWIRASGKQGFDKPTNLICCYPTDDGFVDASVDLLEKSFLEFQKTHAITPRILFSAHGLPEKIVAGGDPYQWACEESAKTIAAKLTQKLGVSSLDWQICYQSRVGPLKWIGPSTSEALAKAAQDKTGVLVYPHAFVSEHVETLVEIAEEYRHLAGELGVPAFERVPTVSTHPLFIAGLARLVQNQLGLRTGQLNKTEKKVCPHKFSQCCQTEFSCTNCKGSKGFCGFAS